MNSHDMIRVACGAMRNPLQHAENRLKQAFEALNKIEVKETSFEERQELVRQIQNHIGTIKADMDRAELLF